MNNEKIQIPENVSIKVIDGVDTGNDFAITNKTMTIGRQDVCNIQLMDRYVSNKHCQIVFRKDHFTAIDLGSLNKTKVNDRVYVQKNLKNNDILTLGKTKLKFCWEEQDLTSIDESDDILGDDKSEEDAIPDSDIPLDENGTDL